VQLYRRGWGICITLARTRSYKHILPYYQRHSRVNTVVWRYIL